VRESPRLSGIGFYLPKEKRGGGGTSVHSSMRESIRISRFSERPSQKLKLE